jgi:hypothetical protein
MVTAPTLIDRVCDVLPPNPLVSCFLSIIRVITIVAIFCRLPPPTLPCWHFPTKGLDLLTLLTAAGRDGRVALVTMIHMT